MCSVLSGRSAAPVPRVIKVTASVRERRLSSSWGVLYIKNVCWDMGL